jgi:hypothetical protein
MIICAVTAERTTIAGITIVDTTATENIVAIAKSDHSLFDQYVVNYFGLHLVYPSINSMLDAGPIFFFSFPSFSYGYQNRACFGILL